MSLWTHIVGVMHVDTYEHVDDIKLYVEEALKGAPSITGSEKDAAVFVNPEPGCNIWVSCDCGRCDHNDDFECNAPEGYRCKSGEYQSRAVITVQGDLRDRSRRQTEREWDAFHRYVTKTLGWNVRIATCRVDGF